MSPDRSTAAWRRPDNDAPDPEPEPSDEVTRTFTDADLAALRALLREDTPKPSPRTPPKPRATTSHRAPPNLGPWLALLLIVLVLAATAIGSLTLWLYLR
jgi:hypothetical protein